ncbi:hypothetical protein [Natronosalvus rutilus]|uniref:Uncharacterized protein n=1 Tax=Natronosalvus rutilus TaxID=2953753 RepID=A0A9E7SX30_9EURY|nr:hypothetical protein [Natronosalvus rutilus]UTF56005.1 hypothetical protein NGM29_20675 [Natronosalvus rutilus]
MADTVSVSLTHEDHIENFENAIAAVEKELGGTLKTSRGRPTEDELTAGEIVNELARSYTGFDVADERENDETGETGENEGSGSR